MNDRAATDEAVRPREVGSALEVLWVSTRLGLTSFGGPIAHLGYFHEEYVRRRKWVDEQSYADLVALCQFLPGPASSKVGIAMQAASQNQLAAYYMGIPVKRLNSLAWGLAAGVAAIAGLLLAPITFVHANMGFIGLKAFPAAVVGGFGSLPGAIVGGLIIGVVESLSGFYLPEGFKDTAAYIVVLVMLGLAFAGRAEGQFIDSVSIGANDFVTSYVDAPNLTSATYTGSLLNCKITLSWTAPATALAPDGYDILRSTANGGPYSLVTHVGTVTSYTDTGLAVSTTYYYVLQSTRSSWRNENSNQQSASTPLLCV